MGDGGIIDSLPYYPCSSEYQMFAGSLQTKSGLLSMHTLLNFALLHNGTQIFKIIKIPVAKFVHSD